MFQCMRRRHVYKHPPLQPAQDPLEHAPVLRLVGVLFWVSENMSRPDLQAQMKLVRVCVFDMLPRI